MTACALSAPAGLAGDSKKDTPEPEPGKDVNFYSLGKEIEPDPGMAQEAELESTPVGTSVTTEYANRIAQSIAGNSDANPRFTVKVIDSDEVHAFSLSGRFPFVNTGLLAKPESEAELAAMLAQKPGTSPHSTGREAQREPVFRSTRASLCSSCAAGRYAARQAAGPAGPTDLLQYTRGTESQADRLGLEYMYKAKYDPNSFVDSFEKVETL